MTPSRTDSVDQLPGHGSLLQLVPAAIAPRDAERDRIVIVGGGFAGATLAQQLERTLGDRADVLVVSKDNHLVFTLMLPEVAARTITRGNRPYDLLHRDLDPVIDGLNELLALTAEERARFVAVRHTASREGPASLKPRSPRGIVVRRS